MCSWGPPGLHNMVVDRRWGFVQGPEQQDLCAATMTLPMPFRVTRGRADDRLRPHPWRRAIAMGDKSLLVSRDNDPSGLL